MDGAQCAPARMRCTALDYRDKLNNDHVLHATWVHAVSAELQQYRTRTGVHVHVRCLQEGGELEWPSAVVAVRCLNLLLSNCVPLSPVLGSLS